MEIWVQNLLSGLIGSVLGALASVWILIATNRHTSRMALKQRELDRDMARGHRELEAVAKLLTFLQTSFSADPMGISQSRDLVGHVNLLALNASDAVRQGWEDVTQAHVRNGRSRRHPLPLALIAWSSADALAALLPNWEVNHDGGSETIIVTSSSDGSRQKSDDDDFRTFVQSVTGAWDNRPLMLECISRLSQTMLRWDVLTDDQKITVFNPLLEVASRRTSEFFAAVNVGFGAVADGHLPFEEGRGSDELVALHKDAALISDFRSGLAFALIENTIDSLDLNRVPAGGLDENFRIAMTGDRESGVRLQFEEDSGDLLFIEHPPVEDAQGYENQAAYRPHLTAFDYNLEDLLAPFAVQESKFRADDDSRRS
ncbi:hypothetical protein [Cryobacterium sp. TMT4-31]|uniref:hypothetical protein n=1 Tax=Cryobacterium sp. TMT4-31 TaxID=1259259 RepID=UPI00106CE5CD|nr:hypothetical protein [Cryobacterium sp. TMT4-31]TFC87446.1 hypothetical protein E3T19_12485 [Cryobacterium sp. TMT4-31]